MDLNQFIGTYGRGLEAGYKSLICGIEFPYASAAAEPSQQAKHEAMQLCRQRVVSLIDEQDGKTLRPERTLIERQQQYRANQ